MNDFGTISRSMPRRRGAMAPGTGFYGSSRGQLASEARNLEHFQSLHQERLARADEAATLPTHEVATRVAALGGRRGSGDVVPREALR